MADIYLFVQIRGNSNQSNKKLIPNTYIHSLFKKERTEKEDLGSWVKMLNVKLLNILASEHKLLIYWLLV